MQGESNEKIGNGHSGRTCRRADQRLHFNRLTAARDGGCRFVNGPERFRGFEACPRCGMERSGGFLPAPGPWLRRAGWGSGASTHLPAGKQSGAVQGEGLVDGEVHPRVLEHPFRETAGGDKLEIGLQVLGESRHDLADHPTIAY